MQIFYLYKITNLLNNKVYIGQSIEPAARWKHHIAYANQEKKPQYIHRAMAKYGVENFVFEIIAGSANRENADEVEKQLIIQYDSRAHQSGYNIKPGGMTFRHSEETRKKLSISYTKYLKENGHPGQGKKRTPEQRARLSEALKNREDYFTPELRQRMSDSHKGKKQPQEQIDKKTQSLAETNARKLEQKLQSGELKCNAPNCDRSGIGKYYLINNVRYCAKHGERLKRNGHLNILLPFKYGKDNPMPEEIKKKCGIANIGRKPHNRYEFTEEQIHFILNDPRGDNGVAKDFGVTAKVITRIRKEHGIINKRAITVFSPQEIEIFIELYINQLYSINQIAKKYDINIGKIRWILLKNGIQFRSKGEQMKINNKRKNGLVS